MINLPVGVLALWLLAGVQQSRRRESPFDWSGQFASIIALSALTYGLIDAGTGVRSAKVLVSLLVGCAACVVFLILQTRKEHPMVPLGLFRPRNAATPIAIGFTFMVGFYGMVFLISLFFQEERHLTPYQTGMAFVPVTAFSIVMPVLAARLGERFGAWLPIVAGQAFMVAGLFGLSILADSASVPYLVALMIPVGLGAGLAMPSATSLLLNAVEQNRSGTASGVLNTSRQVGGALAIAAFGALVAGWGYDEGMRVSFVIAGSLLTLTMLASLRLRQ